MMNMNFNLSNSFTYSNIDTQKLKAIEIQRIIFIDFHINVIKLDYGYCITYKGRPLTWYT